MTDSLAIIQQLLDQAIKSGIVGNLATAAAVSEAWQKIVNKLNSPDGSADNNNNS